VQRDTRQAGQPLPQRHEQAGQHAHGLVQVGGREHQAADAWVGGRQVVPNRGAAAAPRQDQLPHAAADAFPELFAREGERSQGVGREARQEVSVQQTGLEVGEGQGAAHRCHYGTPRVH